MLPLISPPHSYYDTERFYGILTVPDNSDVFAQTGYYLGDPTVFLIGSTYYMVYSRYPSSSGYEGYRTDCEICLATANNPAGPFAHDSILLQASGAGWESESVLNAKVIQDGHNWRLFYLGYDSSGVGQIGVATATSIGGPYTRSLNNPIIALGAGGTWDDFTVNNPAPLKDGGTYYVWYKGFDALGGTVAIGLATASVFDGPYIKNGGNPVINPTPNDWEDPHVWKENGKFWMTLVDIGGAYVVAPGTIWLTSIDGITWVEPEFGYKAYEVAWFGANFVERTSFLWVGKKKKYMYAFKYIPPNTYTTIGYAIFPD
jgi:hypothetical protein